MRTSEYIKYSKFNTAGQRLSVNPISQEKCIHGLAVFYLGIIMPVGVYKRTKEYLKDLKNQGFKKGQIAWNKGLTKKTDKRILKYALSGGVTRIGQEAWNNGKILPPLSLKHRLKISKALKGEKGSGWRGGITPINAKIRNSMKFKLWREAVFERDNYTCQMCGQRGGKLRPHHIWNFALFIYLRFNIDNGITLCKECHKEVHKKGA